MTGAGWTAVQVRLSPKLGKLEMWAISDALLLEAARAPSPSASAKELLEDVRFLVIRNLFQIQLDAI